MPASSSTVRERYSDDNGTAGPLLVKSSAADNGPFDVAKDSTTVRRPVVYRMLCVSSLDSTAVRTSAVRIPCIANS